MRFARPAWRGMLNGQRPAVWEEIIPIGVDATGTILWRKRSQRMSEGSTEQEPSRRILAELSALADGTLAPNRAERLRELIATSPDLAARYERERRAVLALQRLNADRAPTRLRAAVEARRHREPERPRRRVYGGALAASAALAALLLALLLPDGSPGAPSVSEAAALALRGQTMPAPAAESKLKLGTGVGETYFPNWVWFGWRAAGERTDRLDGKLAVTVYYERQGRQVAYTILAAPPLRWPGSRMIHLNGIALQSFISHGRLVVTWRRAGHTCVLSGWHASTAELAKLAGWEVPRLDS